MADVIKSTSTLQIVAEFVDSDDRTLSLDDPKLDISAAQINSVAAYIKDNNLLIGDKEGASFARFKSAQKISQTTRYLDLTTA